MKLSKDFIVMIIVCLLMIAWCVICWFLVPDLNNRWTWLGEYSTGDDVAVCIVGLMIIEGITKVFFKLLNKAK